MERSKVYLNVLSVHGKMANNFIEHLFIHRFQTNLYYKIDTHIQHFDRTYNVIYFISKVFSLYSLVCLCVWIAMDLIAFSVLCWWHPLTNVISLKEFITMYCISLLDMNLCLLFVKVNFSGWALKYKAIWYERKKDKSIFFELSITKCMGHVACSKELCFISVRWLFFEFIIVIATMRYRWIDAISVYHFPMAIK